MTEWEALLFVCIVGMVHLWLAVDNLQDHQRRVELDLLGLKIEVDAMAAREAKRLKKGGEENE